MRLYRYVYVHVCVPVPVAVLWAYIHTYNVVLESVTAAMGSVAYDNGINLSIVTETGRLCMCVCVCSHVNTYIHTARIVQ
jgi:hypothetical protein